MAPSEALSNLLDNEDCPQWPDELFRRMNFDTRSAAHMLQQRMIPGSYTSGSDVRTTNRASRNQTHAPERNQEFSRQEEQERPSVDL
ncbi:hypothetical protein M011DRAFT_195931, partial [Sporormia fimetaria CBS 119925]